MASCPMQDPFRLETRSSKSIAAIVRRGEGQGGERKQGKAGRWGAVEDLDTTLSRGVEGKQGVCVLEEKRRGRRSG